MSRENKSRVKVRSGGENELRGCQLSFTLYSLKSLPCVRALFSVLSIFVCIYICPCGEAVGYLFSCVGAVKAKKKKIFRFPLFFLFLYDFVTSSLHLFHPDLIHCTNDVNVNIPHLADTLFERTANSSWVVVFKALITTHHLMMYGNEVGGFFTKNSQTNQKQQPNKPSKTVN